MKKNCIGITGSTGLIGSHFIKQFPRYKFDKFKGDILVKSQVDKWIKNGKFSKIIHLAAKVPTSYVNSNFIKSKNINYQGTKNLLKSVLKFKKKEIKWFFFASTSHVYKMSKNKLHEKSKLKPYSKYGYTKLLAESYLKKVLPFKICIGRIFSVTHPKQHLSYAIPSVFNRIKKSKDKILFLKNLNHDRDFCHVKDVCYAINILYLKNLEGIYNIGTSKKVNLKFIARFFSKKYNKKIIFIDNIKKTTILSKINKIKKIGFKPKYNLKQILREFK
tara:strand:- start:202 stop:1026 length:825 start_codon:yes stop_codon:yes gene_type:complete